jgi:adenosylcobyric acid synthase
MTAKTLMVVGSSSSAGKSWLVTALCRIYARRGVRVAPFKAQNMSNNAAVCADGAEIGRAQAVQALTAGVAPTADMNPILLKPESDARSQVVILGRAQASEAAADYYRRREALWQVATGALDRLRDAYELVIIEGAGSPVELNLLAGDIVNMPIARYANAPTLIVGDIDRGGIFAQLLGTLWLMAPEDRALVAGLVVNKFRGDAALFEDGVRILEERGGVPVLGVIPYLHGLGIPEEDAVALDAPGMAASAGAQIDIAVVRLPHIANFDDFDPLAAETGVQVRYVTDPGELGRPHAVILPGTKSTLADLDWLRRTGLAEAIRRLAGAGAAVAGICGGYQMLGSAISDPLHSESPLDEMAGLGLLPHRTMFGEIKETHQAQARITGGPGWLAGLAGQEIDGYEIHMGRTEGESPWLVVTGRSGKPVAVPDGSVSAGGRVWGCYLHGLFGNEPLRRAWLASLGWQGDAVPAQRLEAAFDRMADVVEGALELDRLGFSW